MKKQRGVTITSGQVYDMTNDSAASTVCSLTEGSLFVEFKSTSRGQYQSLCSISNPTSGNQDRHFHMYITPTRLLGMELRNTDAAFKYTMTAPGAIVAGQSEIMLWHIHLADAFSSGHGFNNVVGGTGFKVSNGQKYIKLQWHQDASEQYNYSIRDNGIIYNDVQNLPTEYSVDGNYRLKHNGAYLTQKQYEVVFQGTTLLEQKTNVDVNMCVFYKDSIFRVLPTNYLTMKYSDDEGEAWSDLKILGSFRNVDQRMVLFGPGVSTQIKNGSHSGRLLILAYNSVSGDYGYLYSDDHGANWSFVNTNLGGSGNFAEAQIVEFPDGSLCTYMRTNNGKIGYITSTDGGMTRSATSYISGISVASYGTQLSVINYSKPVNGKPAIIMSTPTSANGRRSGTILVGLIEDTGATGQGKYNVNWTYRYAVDRPTYGFSYSCMTELPDSRVGILYERYDSWLREELHLKNIMRYETYTIDELTM